ncbi:MAG: 3-phosphoshikimate 1-carboxyvinyltransferase, partial [Elusimicrobiota bacterium]|nr:3-phosphoshikimate 1-carboxyvinyltransferase [Elusimicrobiota bacterium]
SEIPSIIDEVPLIALLACRAEGKTIINGAGELRKKETDRLHAVSTQLQRLGQSVEEQSDSLVITGNRGPIKGGKVTSFKDHRIAMMLSIAGLIAAGKVIIDDVKCVETSFPEFYDILTEVTGNE